MNKKLLLLLVGGGVGYYLYSKAQQNKAAAAHAAAAAAAMAQSQPLMSGSDSMMAGTMSGVLLGKHDDAPRQHRMKQMLRQAGQANLNFR